MVNVLLVLFMSLAVPFALLAASLSMVEDLIAEL
jgi:hypothetical protein